MKFLVLLTMSTFQRLSKSYYFKSLILFFPYHSLCYFIYRFFIINKFHTSNIDFFNLLKCQYSILLINAQNIHTIKKTSDINVITKLRFD